MFNMHVFPYPTPNLYIYSLLIQYLTQVIFIDNISVMLHFIINHCMLVYFFVNSSPVLLQKLSSWIKMRSVMQAKSKIGHAVILILQVEVLEKFKYVTTTSPLDLACYAGVVLLSSASIFILSRIALSRAEE